MIESSEHFYDDDPARGHPDARTRLDRVSYFFLGNGLIQAAVQWAPAGDATPLGLLVMDPDRLGKKREALTFDPACGLEATAVAVRAASGEQRARQDALRVGWTTHSGVPAVEASWRWSGGTIVERFFCPDRSTPSLVREVAVHAAQGGPDESPVTLRTAVPGVGASITIESGDRIASFIYDLAPGGGSVGLRAAPGPVGVNADAADWWRALPEIQFGNDLLDRLWRASRFQLPAAVSRGGRVDGSIWQYNREWVRDQALIALSLDMTGEREKAATILGRLLREFVTRDGAPIDSSESRGSDDVELDQNGFLLYALQQHVLWTGDDRLLRSAWDRVAALADYPLRPEFQHPSGLLHNCREFWERHRLHGIEPGFELIHQVFVSIGLDAASAMALRIAREAEATRWAAAAARLRASVLREPVYALVSGGALVKRRRLDGTLQDRIEPLSGASLPPSVPLARPGPHWLNPDTCAALPIVYGFVEPGADVAARTLDGLEALWGQAWAGGGYGRYHVASEPDSPGPWPFASLFVARAALEAGRPETAWRVLRWLDTLDGAPAGSFFEFYGPRAAPPFPQVGVIPWTWAELIALMVRHVLGVSATERGIRVRPRVPPGLERVAARMAVGGAQLHLAIVREGRQAALARVRVDGGRTTEAALPEVEVPAGASEAIVECIV